jgi:predicted nucleic acid-binding protein
VRPIVLDASVGVKWFRDEPGSLEARDLLLRHGRSEIELVVPSLFVYEVVGVATRALSCSGARDFWWRFVSWRIGGREVGGALLEEALLVREKFGCSFYDAVAPALAAEMGGQLCSAKRRAHGEWPDVQLLG